MYYIYHIPGVKIGCSSEVKKRVKAQGYSEFEILETHEDIYEASRREIELQKEYGYKVDKNFYYIALEARLIAAKNNTINGNIEKLHIFNKLNNIQSKAGKVGGKITALSDKNWNKQKRKCIYCGFETTPGNIGRHHNERCKHKPKL